MTWCVLVVFMKLNCYLIIHNIFLQCFVITYWIFFPYFLVLRVKICEHSGESFCVLIVLFLLHHLQTQEQRGRRLVCSG